MHNPSRALLFVAVLGLLGCGGRGQAASTPPADPAPAAAATPSVQDTVSPGAPAPTWISVDSVGRSVTLTLEAAAGGPGSSALINGYRNGGVRVVVPLGWTVRWTWRNGDSTAHSLVAMVQREKIPLEGGRPAFSNAMTREVTRGLPAGQTDQTTFEADEAGWYWLLCGVPDHALKGEWIELRVDPAAKTGGITVKSGAQG
jgi:Sulfocyanin (SoxE) domain